MSTEWIELNGIEDVARAKVEKWDIEHMLYHDTNPPTWVRWEGRSWFATWQFRGRPKQPKTSTVKVEGWLTEMGTLVHIVGYHTLPRDLSGWRRVPSEDKTVEVEE